MHSLSSLKTPCACRSEVAQHSAYKGVRGKDWGRRSCPPIVEPNSPLRGSDDQNQVCHLCKLLLSANFANIASLHPLGRGTCMLVFPTGYCNQHIHEWLLVFKVQWQARLFSYLFVHIRCAGSLLLTPILAAWSSCHICIPYLPF